MVSGLLGIVAAVLLDVSLGGQTQFIVPILAETGRQRLFQELVSAQAEATSEHFGTLTYFPAMQIDGREIRVLGQPYRV